MLRSRMTRITRNLLEEYLQLKIRIETRVVRRAIVIVKALSTITTVIQIYIIN